MALENQPFFRAPSVPKLGRRNISSSIFSNASKLQPQLKTSTFSFLKPVQKEQQGSSITDTLTKVVSGEDSKDKQIYSALVETNRILVEIQKQLSLDFASRITEKKQSLGSLRASMLKKRAAQKEKAIESVNNDAGIIRGAFDKITAPAKGIFDRIIEFVSTIATGFVVNAAFGWLSNKKNRQKLLETFEFLTKHWKWLVGIFIGAKLVGAIIKIVNLVRRLKGLIELIRKVWGKPPKPPGGGGGKSPKTPKPPDGKPPTAGDPCGPVKQCFDKILQNSASLAALAAAILATAVFTPVRELIGSPAFAAKKPLDTKSGTPRAAVNAALLNARPDLFGPGAGDNRTAEEKLFESANLPGWLAPVVESLISAALMKRGIARTSFLRGNPNQYSVQAGPLQSRFANLGQGVRNPKPKTNVTVNDPFSKAVESLRKRNYSYSDLRTILNDPKTSALDKKAAEKILTEAGQRTFSGGGTVGGTGPGNVDSVPAMLAPGEEVIRTSSANLFRPLLKDINDNAGTMWLSFKDAIQEQEKNNARQASINTEFSSQIDAFNKELNGLIKQEKQKKIKDANVKINQPKVGNIPSGEGTGKGGPSDTQKTQDSGPRQQTKIPKPFTGSLSSEQNKTTTSSPAATPAPAPAATPPPVEPTPTVGPQRIPVELYNPSTPQLTPVKSIPKSYSFNTLKPESGSKIAMLSYPMPPITMKQSSGQRNVSEATPPPTAKTTNSLDGYISLAAMEYGILT